MILGIDFDGTCIEDRFPHIGQEILGCETSIKEFLADGHQVFIWTCRQGQYLRFVQEWFAQRGIQGIRFNESPADNKWEPEPPRKAYADIYIDDRGPRGFPGWEQISNMIKMKTDENRRRKNDLQ